MTETSDRQLLDTIRRHGPLTVAEMVSHLGVTQTAVRNRLTRLVEAGLVERQAQVGARGRPKHSYQASTEAHKRLGQNYADLALVLWDEMMRTVEDRKLRRFLFGRITDRMAEMYRSEITADAWEGRLVQLGTILHGRGVEAEVTRQGDESPILKQHSCPYFALAETDRSVCAMERKMFEKVLGHSLRLSQCRLDGHRSCDFESKPGYEPPPAQAG
ncbi:MAG: putative transcriptional regulator [Planctomycetota bacterium]|nr:putative transcriptional regulator [Planctomycetota bacterium]